MANKGVIYARIRKQEMAVHVFATHANARAGAASVRLRQFAIIRDLVERCAIPSNEPVLITGDMNVHRERRGEYESMLEVLGAQAPSSAGHPYSFDPRNNRLAIGLERMHLDYVLYSTRHRQPARSETTVCQPSCERPWRRFPFVRPLRELSDHYPVVGRFWFD